ncbi:hypothetical protein [uncultured Sanguibacteroides sp.]|uniref:hypothetical protein n=1 Tax=uncultured Sanguibacteroides sp. TaxID=1635151 RepID=UPI0025E5F966|nr:hypothetical protein [uncultured Sanguibacteroides sp.]
MKSVLKMVVMTLVLWVGSVSMTANHNVVKVRVGESVILDFSPLFPDRGTGSYNIRYYKEGQEIKSSSGIVIKDFILYIPNVRFSDMGRYVCVITNEKGSYTAAIDLIVEDWPQ